jgi:hypothetical protein
LGKTVPKALTGAGSVWVVGKPEVIATATQPFQIDDRFFRNYVITTLEFDERRQPCV